MKALFFYITALLSASIFTSICGQMYEESLAIHKTFLDKKVYKPEIIPVKNQSTIMKVYVEFSLVSIVAVDDTTQSFVCNGFFHIYWAEERVRWDPRLFGGLTLMHPLPKEIWRPRVILINTLKDRDPFGDDISPVVVFYNGTVSWVPGGLLTTSCALSLLKYPFDEQRCSIDIISMGFVTDELEFKARQVLMELYTVNGEWDLVHINIKAITKLVDSVTAPGFEIQFHIKRRSTFYVMTIILPFVILSFLNMLVFTIPQDSGEKIGYGITILLALSVFFSIIGGMLPRSSNIVPYVIIYLFTLYVISVLTVLDSMAIAFLYSLDGKPAPQTMVRFVETVTKLRTAFSKMSSATTPLQSGTENQPATTTSDKLNDVIRVKEAVPVPEKGDREEKFEQLSTGVDNYKMVATILNFISGIAFLIIWLCVTLWFFQSVLT